jgi:hypothetical protein
VTICGLIGQIEMYSSYVETRTRTRYVTLHNSQVAYKLLRRY